MSAVSRSTKIHLSEELAADSIKKNSKEGKLFDERIATELATTDVSLTGTPSIERFQQRVKNILSLKGEGEWRDLFQDRATAKAMGEFFKFVETTAKAIIHNQIIDEEHLPLALDMIRFLAIEVCQSSPGLMWNLWLFRETKSDLRDSINFILSEILGVDDEDFERAQKTILEEKKQIDRKSFFELQCGSGGFASLYQNEYLITLDPIQILLLLAFAYPKKESEKLEPSPPSSVLRHRRPVVPQQTPRTTQVKPLNRDKNGPCNTILPLIGGIATAVFAIYALS